MLTLTSQPVSRAPVGPVLLLAAQLCRRKMSRKYRCRVSCIACKHMAATVLTHLYSAVESSSVQLSVTSKVNSAGGEGSIYVISSKSATVERLAGAYIQFPKVDIEVSRVPRGGKGFHLEAENALFCKAAQKCSGRLRFLLRPRSLCRFRVKG
jgi:hypothetical protein